MRSFFSFSIKPRRSRKHKQGSVYPLPSLSFSTSCCFSQPSVGVCLTDASHSPEQKWVAWKEKVNFLCLQNVKFLCWSLAHGVMGLGDGVFRWLAKVTWGRKCSRFRSKHLQLIPWKEENSHRYDYICILEVSGSSYRLQENWARHQGRITQYDQMGDYCGYCLDRRLKRP